MDETLKPTQAVQVTDLVLEPLAYHDALVGAMTRDTLGYDDLERITGILPLAIAQLDAIGDEYGIMALDGLYGQLTRLQAV